MIYPSKARNQKPYRSPVLCFKSRWVDTGEQEKYFTSDGHTKYRTKVKLVYKLNPEYKES